LAWSASLRAHVRCLLAGDFFAVETRWLQVLHGLFFVEVRARPVVLAGGTAHPTAAWVKQRAREVSGALKAAGTRPTVLLHHRDSAFPPTFAADFAAQPVRVVRTPSRSAGWAPSAASVWIGCSS
jgi:hypothetical protein